MAPVHGPWSFIHRPMACCGIDRTSCEFSILPHLCTFLGDPCINTYPYSSFYFSKTTPNSLNTYPYSCRMGSPICSSIITQKLAFSNCRGVSSFKSSMVFQSLNFSDSKLQNACFPQNKTARRCMYSSVNLYVSTVFTSTSATRTACAEGAVISGLIAAQKLGLHTPSERTSQRVS